MRAAIRRDGGIGGAQQVEWHGQTTRRPGEIAHRLAHSLAGLNGKASGILGRGLVPINRPAAVSSSRSRAECPVATPAAARSARLVGHRCVQDTRLWRPMDVGIERETPK